MAPSRVAIAGDDIFTVPELLTADECRHLIRHTEALGYEPAPITTVSGPRYVPSIRDNERVMVDDFDRAGELWRKAREHVPQSLAGWTAIGLNERLRFYRYENDQQFDWHRDGHYERDNGERSFLTFMVYLNDDFTGGETAFVDNRDEPEFADLEIRPARGLALFFAHPLLHKGNPVLEGRKYVLRSDVMYRRN